MISSRAPLRTLASRVVGMALVAIVSAACSAVTTQAVARVHTASTQVPMNPGVIQLRPLIPPTGASQLACTVGEALGPCIGSADFVSWGRPARECPPTRSTTNPPPAKPTRLTWSYRATRYCVFLAPASFTVTTATSVKTNIGTLNGNPGIEFTVPPAQAPALDAALSRTFKKPLAFVADGQIVAIDDVQPTASAYQPMGGVLIFYGSSASIQKIALKLNR